MYEVAKQKKASYRLAREDFFFFLRAVEMEEAPSAGILVGGESSWQYDKLML